MASSPTSTALTDANASSRAGFDALFERYAPKLKAFFMHRGETSQAAEELVQEVMLTVWRKADQYDPERASPATWIFAIARNRHLDRLRRRRPEPDPNDPYWEGDPPGRDPDEQVAANRRREKLREALADLPDELRNVLSALYFDGKSMSEVATETGIPLGTIKTRARRALAQLRAATTGDIDS